jgi:hypothetical protein
VTAQLIQFVPRFWLLAGAGLAVILLEAAVLLFVSRRPPSSRLTELTAALAPLVVVALWVLALQSCRHLILRPLAESGNSEEQAELLARGMSGQLHTLVFGSLLASVVLLLGGLGASMAVTARLRSPGPKRALIVGATLAFLALGLGPILRDAFLNGLGQMKLTGSMANLDPALKVQLFEEHLQQARAHSDLALLLSRLGIAVVAIAAGWALIRRPPSPGRGTTVLTIVFAGLAVAAVVASWPLRRENAPPWPPLSAANVGLVLAVQTPNLDGPDPVERAPVLVTTAQQAQLGRVPIGADALEDTLWKLRNNFSLLHRGDFFNRLLIFACSPDTPRATLQPLFSAARRAGYERLMFTFVRKETVVRPMLGTRERTLATAARLTLVSDPELAEEGSVTVDLAQTETCADLGARLVGLRRAGKEVSLVIGK